MKCERCNRTALATALYEIPSKQRETRLCNNCAAVTISVHGEDYLKQVRGSKDDGTATSRERGSAAVETDDSKEDFDGARIDASSAAKAPSSETPEASDD